MTVFKYRFVRFGTRFTSADGARPNRSADPAALYRNELAVDVGSVCWGLDGETLPVLDHHFHRAEGQYPSAAAAVLHNAHNIRELLANKDDEIWLVSHQQPDFDAFSAMYLARQIIAGRRSGRRMGTVWDLCGRPLRRAASDRLVSAADRHIAPGSPLAGVVGGQCRVRRSLPPDVVSQASLAPLDPLRGPAAGTELSG